MKNTPKWYNGKVLPHKNENDKHRVPVVLKDLDVNEFKNYLKRLLRGKKKNGR